MSVSLISEFHIFYPSHIQTPVFETTELTYKSIASAEQSYLELQIHADNYTYVDLNKKLNIRGKLIKADGTNLDNTYFTAVNE